ncbi:helix-turn-helix transcriptional regulator [Fructobacillus tropaeoli]|uniref:HTH cro/C1-type domain-containing protein n=1 Tax=Fructobacillus tropaeoli TaxID=709323 RepID=A0ABN9YQ71_9LACO|nr:hypothetical protein R53137_KAKDMLNK_00256 [Fructobacillus tropaeoli]CAK1234464.1 hypothetical protein LMG30238_FMBOGHMB_00608 [Fructobacillus tropaeoli]
MWKKIQSQLDKKNKSVYWLSKQSGINLQTLYSMKRNKNSNPSFSNIEKISEALEVNLDFFRSN